jgi:integrase
MSSYDVQIKDITRRTDRKAPKPYRLRWTVARSRFEKNFATKGLADSFRADLMRAARAGLPFDTDRGVPVPWLRAQNETTWYLHARAYAEMKWPHLAAKSRRSMAEALATVTPELVTGMRGAPGERSLRRALYGWAFNPSTRIEDAPDDVVRSLAWTADHSVPVSRLGDADLVRAALDALARRLDGKPAAATVVRRKRAVFYNALGYAVERGQLDFNPIDRVQWKAPAVGDAVDRRVVANTAQVEAILRAVPDVHDYGGHLVAFFGCMYYAGMRPSEVASLKRGHLTLPATGWGRVDLVETAPHAGGSWTDDGEARDVRGLKHRAAAAVRPIPIPPELVDLLRRHLDTFGAAADGRLFYGARGGYLPDGLYARIWRDARANALTAEQAASPLARRPYDLRHAAVSLWLNGGVPAPEVAQRAGHGVAVLLKVYAGCIDGEEESVNTRIETALTSSRERGQDGGGRASGGPS